MRDTTEVCITHQGAPGPPGTHRWVVAPSGHPSGTSLSHPVFSGPGKFSEKFRCFWTPFGIYSLRSKKQEKNYNWHSALVNRLVPKNDIKLL